MSVVLTRAAKVPKLKSDFSNLAAVRLARGENQQQFWYKYGVTQSGGSRYESGRPVPTPTRLLILAHESGLIPSATLDKLRQSLARA